MRDGMLNWMSFITVLNRAHPEKDPSKTAKKTISGRTFARA